MLPGYLKDKRGFTLVELMVSVAILGVLTATSIPLVNAYRLKAEFLEIKITMKYLMDGMETHYIETSEFYPPTTHAWTSGKIEVNQGEAKAIPELKYTFKKGHKHKFIIERFNIPFWNIDYVSFKVEADFDYDRDGDNDIYFSEMLIINGEPILGQYRLPLELIN